MLARIGRFVERLPGSGSLRLVVGALVIESGVYSIFVQQCQSNTQNLTRSTGGCILAARRPGRRHGIRQAGVLAQAVAWARVAEIHRTVVLSVYFFNLIKYRLVALIGNGSILSDYQFLDCFIPGRFRFVGRTNKISGEIASVFMLWFLAYRLVVEYRAPKFKFYALEFLMTSREDVASNAQRAGPCGTFTFARPEKLSRRERTSRERGARTITSPDEQLTDEKMTSDRGATPGSTGDTQPGGVNSIFYIRSPFEPNKNKWILRPNRTEENWLVLNLSAKFLCYWTASILFYTFCVFYWALAGPVLTNLGFEMAYPSCVAWLRDRQHVNASGSGGGGGGNNGSSSGDPPASDPAHNSYSYIYSAPRVLAHEIPIDNIPARIPLDTRDLWTTTPFGLARIALDVMDNHLVYFEYVVFFTALYCQLIIQAIDVSLNAAGIRARLERLLGALEAFRHRTREHEGRLELCSKLFETQRARNRTCTRGRTRASASPAGLALEQTFDKTHYEEDFQCHAGWAEHLGHSEFANVLGSPDLSDEIGTTQAMLADHFDNLTRGYNSFISFLLCCLALLWLHYTLILCVWMSSIRSRVVELEFVLAESSATVTCIFFLAGAASVRSRNMQLYHLIARAMALDPDWLVTKPRWATILKYFHPKPYYCFTVLSTTEISWLFCFKLLSWTFSAFILLANFFYMNRL